MGKGDFKKQRGKMSSYAFFVQSCWEEHSDASVNVSEFSKKYSERWKAISVKEKGKFEIWQRWTIPTMKEKWKLMSLLKRKTKNKFRDPSAPKRTPSTFFLFSSEYCLKIKDRFLAYTFVMLQRSWEKCGITLL